MTLTKEMIFNAVTIGVAILVLWYVLEDLMEDMKE